MEFATTHGTVPFRYHEGEGRGLVVVYPGLHYPAAYPLLYCARKTALFLGWDVVELEYDLTKIPRGQRGTWLEELAHTTLAWAEEHGPRVVLLGKSLGTVLLAIAPVTTLSVPWGRVWVTPLVRQKVIERALAKETRGLAFAGGRDRYIPKEIWDRLAHPGLTQVWLEDADHKLEDPDPRVTLDHCSRYLHELIGFMRAFDA